MRDNDDKLNKGELIDIKSLIGDADGGDYSLDDIMAEYGHPASPAREQPEDPEERFNTIDLSKLPRPAPRPESPARSHGRVVAFPGTRPAPAEEEVSAPEPEEELPEPEEELPEPPEPEPEEEEGSPAPVIPFPKEESPLSAFIKDLNRKADDYAEHMFEEDESIDKMEVRRLERLIPGTDQEELDDEPPPPPFWRRERRPEKLPPDIPPQKLAWKYGRGLKWMRTRALLIFLLTLLSLGQTLAPLLGLVWTAPLDRPDCQCWVSVGLLGAGVLLAFDVLLTGIARACFLKFGMDTLAALACGFTLADGTALALGEVPPDRLPYTLVCLAGLFCLLHGSYHKRCGLRLSCRAASSSASPYRVTLDPSVWSDRDTYAKWSGTPEDFGSQIQADDGAQRVFRRICPLLLLGGAAFALQVSVGGGHPERLLWALSAQFTAAAAFGSSLAFGRTFHKTARRLSPSGAALAGWPGIAASRRGSCVLLTDGDLFPPGYVELNGFKVLGDYPSERVVAYTATLIREAGSGLSQLFHDQLRSMGGLLRRADSLQCHEGGGLSANIRGDQVLVGSAAFMKLMEIKLPQGLNVKSAVFCAIDGKLAGIFALSYVLPDTVFPALEALFLEKVEPILATRDFNLIPAMLHQRFKLAADKMAFPPVERRRELSDPDQIHEGVLTALLCREGLLPFAEAIAAAKRLRWATRLGAWLCCAASLLGVLLTAYLTSVGAYTSLSPLNLLVYMLTWLAPVWFLSGWAHRF
ncbi:hypothetical protein [Colidextribacter sp. OB.20]|uniref:hypothetical protein n=1 Tax=Colidextribacter sp. OB.20 TaxID=2304568 RepID=UPI001FACA524|nr:hypothetical protein [Colidextribacter sp. OB.20]